MKTIKVFIFLCENYKGDMELRERIIEGAAELFRIYGIKAVTMDSLASHLGVSKRTIYEVFSNKDDLLIGVIQRMAEKHKELLKKILDDSENALVAIFKLLESSRDHIQEMSPAFQADIKKFHYEGLIKKTDKCDIPDYRSNIQIIERGVTEKLFRQEINTEIVNRCLYSLGKSIMDNELYPFEQFTRQEVMRNIFINYLKGISTPQGIELINKLEVTL
jgi:TetR/AcrR family transcriptional regulator, cholesterol catabolism regulator